MKRITITLSLFLLFSALAFGQGKTPTPKEEVQTNTEEIHNQINENPDTPQLNDPCSDCKEYLPDYECVKHFVQFDFTNPKCIALPWRIKEGQFYRVQIDNINPNVYAINLEHDSFKTSTPLSMPIFSGIDLSSISEYIGDFANSQLAIAIQNTTVDKTDGMSMPEMEKVNNVIEVITATPPVFAAINDQEKIKQRIAEQDALISQYAEMLFESNRILDSLQFELVKKKLNHFKAQIQNSGIAYDSFIKKYNMMREEIAYTYNNINKSLEKYDEFLSVPAIDAFLKDPANANLKKKAEKPQAKYKELLAKITEFKNVTNASGIEKQLMPFVYLHKKNGFSSMPIQFNGGQEKLKISFTPKDSSSGLQKLGPYTYTFPPKSNWYWSVGTSIYKSGLSDERAGSQLVAINDSTNHYQLFEEDQLDGELGVAALLRVGKKAWWLNSLLGTDGVLGIHGSFGTGLSIGKDVRPRMLVGGGLSIGKTHNIMLDAGYVIGYVDELSKKVKADFNQTYIEAPQPLVTQLRSAGFISLGYAYIF